MFREDTMDAYSIHPHAGVYPIVTPPNWDIEVAPHEHYPDTPLLTRWHLEVPLKSFACCCDNMAQLRSQLDEVVVAENGLKEEGWRLDWVFDGVMYLSASHLRRLVHLQALRHCFTRSLAFGVLREV
jgi:hypothetical protein